MILSQKHILKRCELLFLNYLFSYKLYELLGKNHRGKKLMYKKVKRFFYYLHDEI